MYTYIKKIILYLLWKILRCVLVYTYLRLRIWNFDKINLLQPTGHVMHQQFNIQ